MRIVHLCCLLALACPAAVVAADGDHEAKKEAHDALKAGTKGVSEGTIVSLEKGKLVLKTGEGNLLFMAHWKGGMPKDGGGLDQEMVARLEKFKAGDRVKIAWVWEERRRIEQIEKK